MEALEALNIATVNVLSLGMMLGGGLLYAFDIASVDDMRSKVRLSIAADGDKTKDTRTDQELEKDLEEWFAGILEKTGHKVDWKPKSQPQENADQEEKK